MAVAEPWVVEIVAVSDSQVAKWEPRRSLEASGNGHSDLGS